MTTYDGRSASYVPGKEVPNKEPPVSKFVVEKLYRVHRLRMRRIEPLVDCHVVIPDFLTNTTWKKNAENSRQAKIASQNLYMFHRIQKVENEESHYKKDTRAHVKRIERKSAYLKKLKVQDRLHRNYKIQRENEYILKRIENAQPEYTKSKMDNWYKHHELFKAGRRSDPTAGHIMYGMGDLLPAKLPPLDASVAGSFDQASGAFAGSIHSSKGGLAATYPAGAGGGAGLEESLLEEEGEEEEEQEAGGRLKDPPKATGGGAGATGKKRRKKGAGKAGQKSLASNSMLSSSMSDARLTRVNSTASVGNGANSKDNSLMQQSLTNESMLSHQQQQQPDGEDAYPVHASNLQGAPAATGTTGGGAGGATASAASSPPHQQLTKKSPSKRDLAGTRTASNRSFQKALDRQSSNLSASAPGTAGTEASDLGDGAVAIGGAEDLGDLENEDSATRTSGVDDSIASVHSLTTATRDLLLLVSKPFALPFESKNCLVQVYVSKEYDENLHLKVVSSGISPQILCDRTLQIDKAYECVNAGSHSSHIIHSSDNEDLASLSALLINMFKEADDDGSGSLTFDEFQALMEQVELGISPQELRFVISEADENENGVVDYEEFVPLAVDLIQSFRARNRAKSINSEKDVELDELIMKSISTKDLEDSANICLEKIYEVDTKKYGLIRAVELKRCLNAVAVQAQLKDNEVSMICQMLPRDQFDRCKYNSAPTNFLETLSKVRFMTMKNAMIESQGSGLQKYLLDLCREEEMRILSDGGQLKSKENFSATGKIPFRGLINILTNSSRLSLSRLQVLVIMSEAHVQEGMINYFQFVPVVAKAIEIMFEPKALRQRAELIEKTDLSPEALLQGMSSEMFEQRLMTLFKSYDIDHSGGLDQNEFIACLESLDLQLTYPEMVALMAQADQDHTGVLRFGDFVGFFTHNLLNLEREKHIRLLQSSMNAQSHSSEDQEGTVSAEVTSQEQAEFIEHLTTIFKLSDKDGTGYVPFEEFEAVLKTFNVNSSKYLTEVMLSELHIDDKGMVDYTNAVSSCGELLKVYRARESAMEEHRQKEDWADAKSTEIIKSHEVELNHIVNYLKVRIRRINESVSDSFVKYNEMVALFRSSASGLARFEANRLIATLLNGPAANRDAASGTTTTGGEGAEGADVAVVPGSAKLKLGGGSQLLSEKEQQELDDSITTSTKKSGNFAGSSSTKSKQPQEGKTFRSHFKTQELYDAVYETRRITIMRGLLEEIDSSTTQKNILDALTNEATRLKEKGLLPEDATNLPVKSCFKILEDFHELRLNRSQILFIISWAECFDKDGSNLEIDKFAEHAANIVSKLGAKEVMETRAEVVTAGSFDDKKVLNGMRESDLEKHLEYAFTTLPGVENGQVSAEQMRTVLKSTPKLALSERECTALVAPFLPHMEEGETVAWKEQLHTLVSMIVTLCRERIVQRRMSLHVTASTLKLGGASTMTAQEKELHDDATSQLKSLSEKLLSCVRIQMDGDAIGLHLPIDNEKRRTSQMSGEDGTYSRVDAEQNLLYTCVLHLPWKTVKATAVEKKVAPPAKRGSVVVSSSGSMRNNSISGGSASNSGNALTSPSSGGGSSNSSSSSGGSNSASSLLAAAQLEAANKDKGASSSSAAAAAAADSAQYKYETTATKNVLLLAAITSAIGELGADTQLEAKVITPDGSIRYECALPVKLPSIALVDREAARQFAANLTHRLYIEEMIGAKESVSMKMTG